MALAVANAWLRKIVARAATMELTACARQPLDPHDASDPHVGKWLNDQLKRTEFMPLHRCAAMSTPRVLQEYGTRHGTHHDS
jgi:hypothetical protein